MCHRCHHLVVVDTAFGRVGVAVVVVVGAGEVASDGGGCWLWWLWWLSRLLWKKRDLERK